MLHDARLVLSRGAEFAAETGQYQRINCACSRAMLLEAASRLRAAVEMHCARSGGRLEL